jgi:hypothetical protein
MYLFILICCNCYYSTYRVSKVVIHKVKYIIEKV